MKNKHIYIAFFSLLLFVILWLRFSQENRDVDLEWIEETPELRKYKDKLDEKGYLTEDDIREIRKIQQGQMNNKK